MIETEAIWNHMKLERPPNTTWRVKARRFDTTGFLAVLRRVTADLDSQGTLRTEAALLSRLIYRMKSKFRNDKGLKGMSKVNRALLNDLSLSLVKDYRDIIAYVEEGNEYVTLPSKQMIEYILVRTQGFAKLMLRIEEVAQHSAHFFKHRISLGHAWSISIMAYAVISRIWILTRHLIKKCCSWYNNLYRYMEEFQAVGVQWLPNNYELPINLESWLAVPWITKAIPRVPGEQHIKDTMFKLITIRESDSEEDIAGSNNVSEFAGTSSEIDAVSSSKETADKPEHIAHMEDTGEAISRHSYDLNRTEKKDDALIPSKRKRAKVIDDTREIGMRKQIGRNQGTGKDDGTEDEDNANLKRSETLKIKSCDLGKKSLSRKPLTIDDINTKSDLIVLLKGESYPDIDKLRWNMIKNKCEEFVNELNTCSGKKKQSILLKKAIRRLRCWIA